MQAQAQSLPLNIGIDEEARQEIASGLSRLLADTYSLYLKTHYFHWNVTGPMFTSLHAMFELQYTELAAAVDIIAERIRSLGVFAPGSYSTFAELSSIPETKDVPNAEEMVRLLVEGNEAVAKTARSIFPAAERGDDQSTLDMLTQRLSVHEKTAWMLRSILTNQ
ncbi:Dps family protein [Floridanema aerugineum]|jgi:starvation-inducible DNA-binding protein|uniref:Dps family protein n=1 Tax=Floridaenema aerugineum BLCC-F46 TaxID=3153654 RepID=A0ABV4X0L6_9CYAN